MKKAESYDILNTVILKFQNIRKVKSGFYMNGFLLNSEAFHFKDLILNFFTHKDFLPSADKIPGTMFTPLHFIFAALMAAIVIVGIIVVKRLPERKIKLVFTIVWAVITAAEAAKLIWECFGREFSFELSGSLPFYPCSIWMYAMPFIIWGKGRVRDAACGYVCTMGLVGGLINFFYPATILYSYSCISFPGFQTFFYHGAMVFTMFVLVLSGYHKISFAKNVLDCFLASIPALIMSVFSNTANILLGTDYMFFRCNSFFLAPIGEALPDGLSFVLAYIIYILFCASPYLISYAIRKRKEKKKI